MAKALKVSGITILLMTLLFQLGCIKKTVGGATEQVGNEAMERGLEGSSSGDTSIVGDVIQLVTGVFSGEKDFDSLLSYFIGLGLTLLGTVIQGSKSKKKLRLEGELQGDAVQIITSIIQKFMDGKHGKGEADVAKKIAAEIKADASKSTNVGAKIHDAVKRVRNAA